MSPEASKESIVAIALYGALLLLISWVHWSSIQTLTGFWSSSLVYYTGALMIPLVIVLAGSRVWHSGRVTESFSYAAAALVFAVALAVHAASLADVMLLQMALLPILVWSGIYFLYDSELAKKLIWLFLVLIFSWPIWDVLIGPLQDLTVWVTNNFLKIIRRTAYVDNETVYIRHGSFVIERGCAGLNFFMAATSIGGLYAYWFARSTRYRVLIMAVSIALAILANWIRVAVVVMVGDLTAMQSPLVADHSIIGDVVFAVVMLPLLLLRESGAISGTSDETVSSTAVGKRVDRARWLRPTIILVLVVVVPAALTAGLDRRMASQTAANFAARDVTGVSLIEKGDDIPDLGTNFESAHHLTSARVAGEPDNIYVDVYSFDLGQDGVELASSDNRWFDTGRYEIEASRSYNPAQSGQWHAARVYSIRDTASNRSYLVITSYVVAGRITANSAVAKALRLLATLQGNPSAAAVVAAFECELECSVESVLADNSISQILVEIAASTRRRED